MTAQLFSNSTPGNTIASPMDIQFRNYYEESTKYVDDGQPRIRGFLQPFDTFLLDDRYKVVEGLLVDPVNGGTGLRNHTIPTGIDLGAEWEENILWITPETACTSVNYSLHFSIAGNAFKDFAYGYLTDDGGFATLDSEVPLPRWDGPDDSWQDVFDESPDLMRRSYILSWWNNRLTAKMLNISSSHIGARYDGQFANYAKYLGVGSIAIGDVDGNFLNEVYESVNGSTLEYEEKAGPFLKYGQYNQTIMLIRADILKAVAALSMTEYDDSNPSSSSKPYVRCGYFYGVPYPSQAPQGQTYRHDLTRIGLSHFILGPVPSERP